MAELISRTGRVQSWMDDPEGRLPVSCTVFVVDDTMEGPEGIEASWRFASHALRNGAGCAIHLSRLRPKGHDNGKGLLASGPISFGKIYSTLMKSYGEEVSIRTVLSFYTLMLVTLTLMSSSLLHESSSRGSSDASTSQMSGGKIWMSLPDRN